MSILEELIVELGLPAPELERIINSAPKRYKVYLIPKKNGGYRTIAQPSRELKYLQRYLLDKYLVKFPVHPSAMAYVKRRNISDNAQAHARNPAIVKLDFVAFFQSIKVHDWKRFLLASSMKPFANEDLNAITRILFFGEGTYNPKNLSIGAPSSPTISNILLYEFDKNLSDLSGDMNVVYTRYADDITISGASIDRVLAFEAITRKTVRDLKYPKLTFNKEKRGVYGPAERRLVTGLVITPERKISIGRSRKRLISSLLHRFSLGQLDSRSQGLLKGLLGFAVANEPDFLRRLRSKYGDRMVDAALRIHVPPRS